MTRGTRLQLLVFLIISVLGITYVGVRYVGLGERFLGRTYTVYVDLAEAGGLFTNASVNYRGVPIGRVTGVTLHDQGARATLRLDRKTPVPVQLHAIVTDRSAVGEQYLDLRPDVDNGPYLHEGSLIPRERTGVPLAPETLLANLDSLVHSVDPGDLTVLIDELGTAFEGSETALHTILDAGGQLLDSANSALPETIRLLRDGRTVLGTQLDSADAIRRWAAGLAQLAHTVRGSDPDLRRLLANGPPAAGQLVALLDGLEPSIGVLLGNLITVNGIAVRRLNGIQQILVVYPLVVAGGYTVAPGDGTAHLGLVVNVNDPPGCVYGRTTTCSSADEARGAGVRGTNHAPRPGGSDPAPPPNQPPATQPAPVSGYDPASGLVLGPDGSPLQFGATGGQYQLAGDQSWKQLLLAGMTP